MTRPLSATLALLALIVAGCTYPGAGTATSPAPATPAPSRTPAAPPTSSATRTGTAKLITAELGKLRVVAARPDVPGYRRDNFGPSWTDDHAGLGGHNGCDTRNDVLAAQLVDVRYRARSKCVVVAGTLPVDAYTGRRTEFRKAEATKVQIDHVYPLGRAWDLGAARWPAQRRVDFANDQSLNLLAVDGPTNASKNDDGPGEWLPVNRISRCAYVLRYLQVARKYALPITKADHDSARTITRTCP